MIYLAAAMIAIWLLVTIYVVFLGQRQRHLEQESEILEELVQERPRAS